MSKLIYDRPKQKPADWFSALLASANIPAMLSRIVGANGVVFYASPLLLAAGVHHAFSTRLGGVSPAPFDSLNLGNPTGCDVQDDYEHIWHNYDRLATAAGCSTGRPCRVHQVHGARVITIHPGDPFDAEQKADALLSDDPLRVLSIRVADCVPVLLSTGDGTCVAAVHAGWRGVIAGVALAALDQLVASSPRPAVLAAIGPCIGYDAFEVGPEVLEAFGNQFGADAPCRQTTPEKGHVNLREAVRRQLILAGVPWQNIDSTDRCTFRDQGEFFSHRRDHGVTGRMAAIIQANS